MFAAERERYGPADYRIWHSSRISGDSVGRGWTVSAGLIGPQVRVTINELCGRLGYVPADDDWGNAERRADLRPPAEAETAREAGAGEPEAQSAAVGSRQTASAPSATSLAPVPEPEFAVPLR